MSARIAAGQHVFVRLPSGNHKVVQVMPGTLVSFGKFGQVSAEALVGLPFYQTYEIVGKDDVRPLPETLANEESALDEQTALGDQILYLGNQTISMEEIEALKQQGLTGDALINRITGAHRDFEKKTEFSKDKYVKRKKAKYMHSFAPLPMSCDALLEMYTDKDPARVLGLDLATLAHMLALANVRPGGHYLVMDETPSVLVAAVLERLGGSGSVTIAHENEHPNLDGLKYFPQWMPSDDAPFASAPVRLVSLLDLLHPEEALPFEEKDAAQLRSSQRQQYARQLYRETQRRWVLAQAAEGFDAVLTATTLSLPDIVPRLVEFAAGSAPLVVYSAHKEELVRLTLALKPDLRVLAPTIVETRLRSFQTLPGRMHPVMTARGYSGALLHALRVFPNAAASAVGMGAQRKKRRVEPPVPKLEQPDASSESGNASSHPDTPASDELPEAPEVDDGDAAAAS